MKYFRYILCMLAVVAMAACDDNDSFSVSPGNVLSFSVDSVKLDTIFSNVPSRTASFWVYNHSSDGIRCSSVVLERGNQSGFRVNVDGTYLGPTVGYQSQNVEIRKNDSIRVYVELSAATQLSDLPQMIEDNLIFNLESGTQQRINLSGWAWNALILRNFEVSRDTTIASEMPVVVAGNITIDYGATLTIGQGTTIYFDNNSGINVHGTLRSMGTAESPVILRGDRLDNMFSYLPYDRVPGQWRGIHLGTTSYGNELQYTDLHSAYNGIVADSSSLDREKLHIFASTIHNCQGAGVRLNYCNARIENTQITNTLDDCLKVNGGQVTVNNCTIAQFYPFDINRGVALSFRSPLQEFICRNTLITGYADDEMQGEQGEVFNYQFEDCIIRTPKITTEDSIRFTRVIFEDPEDTVTTGRKHFKTFDTQNLIYDFRLDSISPAIDKANAETAIPTDRDGRQRDSKPDIGAYEWVRDSK